MRNTQHTHARMHTTPDCTPQISIITRLQNGWFDARSGFIPGFIPVSYLLFLDFLDFFSFFFFLGPPGLACDPPATRPPLYLSHAATKSKGHMPPLLPYRGCYKGVPSPFIIIDIKYYIRGFLPPLLLSI